MSAEKIFKREDGSQVKISASFYFGWSDGTPTWAVSVSIRGKGKKNWLGVYSQDSWEFRSLSGAERQKFVLDAKLKHCTLEEIHEVKMQFWNTLKPEL